MVKMWVKKYLEINNGNQKAKNIKPLFNKRMDIMLL
jgi:hypothetical protein